MTTCEGKTRSRPGSWIKSWCCWPVPALSIIKQWQRQPGPVLIYVVSSEIWARSNGPYTQQLKQQQFYPSESFEICCPYKDSVAKLDAVTKKKWYICVWNVDAFLDFFAVPALMVHSKLQCCSLLYRTFLEIECVSSFVRSVYEAIIVPDGDRLSGSL